MNRITMIGRLVRDPELRSASTGKPVCRMRLAVPRRKRETTEDPGAVFVDVVTFDRTATACQRFLAQGSQVSVDGRLEHRTWETQDKSTRSVYEVIAQEVKFLGTAPNQAPTIPEDRRPEPSTDASTPDAEHPDRELAAASA